MNRIVALLVTTLPVANLLSAMSILAADLSSSSGIEATFSIESKSFTLGQAVRVKLSVVNRSPSPVKVDLGRDRKEHFSFLLTRPDGSHEALPPWPMREGLHALGRLTLAPGSRMEQMIQLDEWTTFTQTGDYLLEIGLNTPMQTVDGPLRIPTARQAFEITERDEVALNQVCDRLTRQIERSSSVREAREAALALARVSEPLAVPYLERALASGKYIENIAIDALGKIGDANAVRVLTAVVNESPQWIPDRNTTVGMRSLRAYRVLKDVAATTTDDALRREIALALRGK